MRFAKLINKLFHEIDQLKREVAQLKVPLRHGEFTKNDLRWLRGRDVSAPVSFAAFALGCPQVRAEYDRREPNNNLPRGRRDVTLDQLTVA